MTDFADRVTKAQEHVVEKSGWDELMHPRGFHGRWVIKGMQAKTTDLRPGGQVHVRGGYGGHVKRGDVVVGNVHAVDPFTKHAEVRLHLEDDHPAVRAAVADNPDMHPDQMEFMDTVPLSHMTHAELDKPYDAPIRVHSRRATLQERGGAPPREERKRYIGDQMSELDKLMADQRRRR